MEVLLYRVEGNVQDGALLRRQILFHFLRYVLRYRVDYVNRVSALYFLSMHETHHYTTERVLDVGLSGHVILEESRHVLDLRVRSEILGVVGQILEHHLQDRV